VDSAAFGATVIVASWYGTREATLALGGAFHRRRLRLVSSQVSTLDPLLSPRWSRERRTDLVRTLLTELPLEELISHRFRFSAATSAYELLETKPEECLQVVLDYV
jgi:threonine dehydrogenase-like Zn-dependent dehydrogenase